MDRVPTAWMLRRDGEAFPVVQHLYGSPDCVEETLYAGEWLYRHTLRESARQAVLGLVRAYGLSLGAGAAAENLCRVIGEKPYIFLTLPFVEEAAPLLKQGEPGDLTTLNLQVNRCLNEEFLRSRLGGLYNTAPGCRDMYFRVSSGEYDWGPVIQGFLSAHREEIDTVTVVWDEESTGRSDFVLDGQGKPVDHRSWREEAGWESPRLCPTAGRS